MYELKVKENLKILKGADYNYIFNLDNGFFARWGKTKEDDPQFSPIGPELLDIEVSTICHRACPCISGSACILPRFFRDNHQVSLAG